MELAVNFDEFERESKQLEAMMSGLPYGVTDHLHGEMCLAAAKVVARAAKSSSAFRDKSGRLRKSLRARRRDVWFGGRKVKDAAAMTVLGGSRGARQGHLIELGTDERAHASSKSVGRITARPVLRPALERSVGDAMTAALAAGRREFGSLAAAARGGRLNRRQIRALER